MSASANQLQLVFTFFYIKQNPIILYMAIPRVVFVALQRVI